NAVIKDFALRYFEEDRPKTAVSLLLKYLDDPDKDIQERVVRLLVSAGQTAVQPLLQGAIAASRAWQLNAVRVLCAARGKSAFKGLLQMLLSGTDEFNKSVCDLMTPMMRELDSKDQDQLHDDVEAFATSLDVKQQRPAAVS